MFVFTLIIVMMSIALSLYDYDIILLNKSFLQFPNSTLYVKPRPEPRAWTRWRNEMKNTTSFQNTVSTTTINSTSQPSSMKRTPRPSRKPTTHQPPRKPITHQPSRKPITHQPPRKPITHQPPRKPTPEPSASDRLSQLILTGETLVCDGECKITDMVKTYLTKSSDKGPIQLKQIQQLRMNMVEFFKTQGMKRFTVTKQFLMTQQNCVVNNSFRLYKYQNAKPIKLSQEFCNMLPKVSETAIPEHQTYKTFSGILQYVTKGK
ncbi:uncharacterized protein [Amphiura filiformis]|uniref:uncharacterized protein n=1 Tax=Amphiura filiformis TaxID=82378 RepID=UPI003B221919